MDQAVAEMTISQANAASRTWPAQCPLSAARLLQLMPHVKPRINSVNMCLQHTAVYYVAKSVVTPDIQAKIDMLTRDAEASSEPGLRNEQRRSVEVMGSPC